MTNQLEKLLGSAGQMADGVLLVDNLIRPLDNPEWARYVTSVVYTQRLLGRNDRQLSIDRHHIVDVITANNLELTRESLTRTVGIRLDAKTPNPESRSFKISNIQSHVFEHREELLSAVVALVQHWLDQGAPRISGPPTLGGFEAWRDLTASILDSCGIPGFLENVAMMEETFSEDGGEQTFVEWWWMYYQDNHVIAYELATDETVGSEDGSEDSILDITGGRKSTRSMLVTRLGKRISGWVDRAYNLPNGSQVAIRRAPKKRHNKVVYYLEALHVPQMIQDIEEAAGLTEQCIEGCDLFGDIIMHDVACPLSEE